MADNPVFSYKKAAAKALFTTKELERFAIVAMTLPESYKINWEQCAIQDSTTKGSFSTSYSNTLKKLRINNCFFDDDDMCAVTPVSTPTGKKRGRKAKGTGDGDDTGAGNKRKKTASRPKSTEVCEEEDDILDEPLVKLETGEDENEAAV